ncbi:MAG: outer membrane lipoprotein chaperone LolA [Gammaproteobacteria bacterium]|nr:outer membrane lipoprotein chaperone LolA [Gammaproteobacteria bacterium]
MHMSRTLLLLAAGLFATGNTPAAGDADRLEAFLNGLNTLEAEFHQSLYDENLIELEQSRGAFLLSRPDRFRWDYRQPEAQLIVADGEKVWIYDRDLAQVTVRKLGTALGATPATLLSSDAPVEKNFEVSALNPSGGLEWIGLKPRLSDTGFAYIRLGFRGNLLELMELIDNFGQLTRVEFKNMKRNTRIDPATFKFEPPKGVDIISDNQ